MNDDFSKTLSVLLIDTKSSCVSKLQRALCDYGYDIVARVNQAQDVLAIIHTHNPELLVVDITTPTQSILDQLAIVYHHCPRPVILFAEQDTPQLIQQVLKSGISAYIVDDIQMQRLPSIIRIAVARFREQLGLREELEKIKEKLQERKLLEKAKGVLMEQQGMSEDQAYQCIRKMAMDKGLTLSVVAENIMDVVALLKSS